MQERWNPWTDAAVMPLADSTHSHGNPTLALTNLTGTTASASNGLTISLSAAAGGPGGGWAVQGSGAYTQDTGTIQFANSNGITFGLSTNQMTASHNGLTTARASNDAVGLNTAATQVTWTVNSSGISLNAGAYLTTAQPPGAYLTTARASNDAVGLNTAATAVTWTVNSSGISLNAGAYLTTAAQSGHSHGNPTLALTNLSGTTASASSGFTLSLSAAAPGAGGGFAAQGSGAYTQNTGTIQFANSNGITFGLSTNQMTASHNGLTTAAASDHSHGNPTLALTNLTGTTASNSAGLTLSLSAAAPGGGAGATLSGWHPYDDALWMVTGIGNASLWLNPKNVQQAFQYDRMVMPLHYSQATNSTLTVSNTVAWGWFSVNANTLSLYKSGSGTFSINGSGTASSSNNSGIRVVSFASTDTITPGNYYLGVVWRTTSAGANASLSHLAISQWASTHSGYIGMGSNTRMQFHIGGGVWTSTTAGIPNSVARSDIRGNSSAFHRPPICFFTSGQITY